MISRLFLASCAVASADIIASRSINSLSIGSGNVTIEGTACTGKDQYGSNNCDLDWGSSYTVDIDVTLAKDIDSKHSFTVDAKIDTFIGWKFTCPICGTTCEVTVPIVKKTFEIKLPKCPIKAGPFKLSQKFALPASSPVPIKASAKGKVTVSDGASTVADIDLTGNVSPSLVEERGSRIVDMTNEPVISADLASFVNSKKAGWVAGNNERFSGYSIGDMRMMLKARADDVAALPQISHDAATLASAPSSFDPRSDACTGPVLDQGFCGSCWAFGATEAISDRLCKSKRAKGEDAAFVQLAPLDLTACDDGFFSMENGCQGGQLGGAWNYAKKTGLVEEDCFPYLKSQGGPVPTCDPTAQPCLPESKFIKTPKCSKQCANGAEWEASKHKLGSVYSVPVEQLKAELATKGPVESAFTVYADFVHYKSGVYSHTTGSALGGHAIKIIGYGTEGGTDYWLVQNSWTTTWGDGGYFKIRAGTDECGIESQAIAGSF